MTGVHQQIREIIRANAQPLCDLALQIHQNPELGLLEKKACAWQVELYRQHGFKVESPFAGLDTAFKAVTGKGRPAFCLMSEYDALPEIGHACGHNLIAGSAAGAGIALAQLMRKEKIPGTIVIMGTPAEEAKGGKVQMIARSALKNMDAVMMAHPSASTTPDPGSSAVSRFQVCFKGLAAHAAAAPEKGVNALDAVLLVFTAVNAWRQQLPESCRIHGVIDNGGAAPNIIPDEASCSFYLRSLSDDYLEKMRQRFKDIATGAALMTGTQVRVEPWHFDYKARVPNPILNQAYVDAVTTIGMPVMIPPQPGRASSDFGDVTVEVPAAHVYFQVTRKPYPIHSREFAKAARSAFAIKQMLKAAEALAVCGWRYLTEADFREQVQVNFDPGGSLDSAMAEMPQV